MSKDIIKTIDVNEFGELGNFPSVMRNWEINKVKPVINEVSVVNLLEAAFPNQIQGEDGHWFTNVFTDGIPCMVTTNENNELCFSVMGGTYLAFERYGGKKDGVNNKFIYTIEITSEDRFKEIAKSFGGILGIFNEDTYEACQEASSANIFYRPREVKKPLVQEESGLVLKKSLGNGANNIGGKQC